MGEEKPFNRDEREEKREGREAASFSVSINFLLRIHPAKASMFWTKTARLKPRPDTNLSLDSTTENYFDLLPAKLLLPPRMASMEMGPAPKKMSAKAMVHSARGNS